MVHRGRSEQAVGFSQGSCWRERPPDFCDLLGDREDFIQEVLLDPAQPALEVCRERRISWSLQFDSATNLTNHQNAGKGTQCNGKDLTKEWLAPGNRGDDAHFIPRFDRRF
jgi:hypothetical protein